MDDSTGFVGCLTPLQEARLQQLWALVLQFAEAPALSSIFDDLTPVNSNINEPFSPTDTITSFRPSPKASSPSLRSRNSFIHRTESNLSRRNSSISYPAHHVRLLDGLRRGGMGSSEIRAARKCLAALTAEEVRFGIITAAKHDAPDAYLLRFLRFAKWDANKAFVKLMGALKWRMKEMHVDTHMLPKGELHALQLSQRGMIAEEAEEGEAFLDQLRMGKCYVHGVDRMNRPICVIRVRLHQPGAQSDDVLKQFITHTIESVKLLVSAPVETASVIFDMNGFSLANMEYAAVKFIIKCFEVYYPESLGVLLIHRAPKIFAKFWKIIKTWIDPRVVEKIHFTRTVDDLETWIARDHIVRELGGDDDWEYEYLEPDPDENETTEDFLTRNDGLAERQAIADEFLASTSQWIAACRAKDELGISEAVSYRNETVEQLRVNYWRLDPYIRARNFLDRTGVLQEGGRVEFYPRPKPVIQIQTAKILQVEHVERARVRIINV